MDSVFEVHSPVVRSKTDAYNWIRRKILDIISDVEMFKRVGVLRDWIPYPANVNEKTGKLQLVERKGKLFFDVAGVVQGGTVFRLGLSFQVKEFNGGGFVVFCDVGFSWISPQRITRNRLAKVKNLKNEWRQVKFFRAFSEKKGAVILVRWDNAPHHSEAGTWPFHKHFGGQKVPACPSQEQSVAGFLEFIKAHLSHQEK